MREQNRKIRILESLGSLEIGGNEVFVMNFFRHVDKEKFQIDFVIYDDSKMDFYDEIVAAGSMVYICKSNIHNSFLNCLDCAIKVRKILNDNSYDIIHCHSCSFMGIIKGVIAGKLNGNVKIISHSHNTGTPKENIVDKLIRNILKRYLSKSVDLGFACSYIAAESKYTYRFIKSSKFSIINNAVDVGKFIFNPIIREEVRKSNNISNEFIIGTVGRMEEQKNQKFLLKVFDEYQKINSNSKLMIIGDGVLRSEIENMADKIGIRNKIIFIGKTKYVEKYYQAMDVFVLTSIYEGFGFVNIEAQLSGLSCLVSDVVPKEVDISGKIRFLSLKSSAAEWASEVQSVYTECKDSIRRSVTTVEYDIICQVKKLENYYLKVLE